MKRVIYLDNLRLLATLLVVVGHATTLSIALYQGSVNAFASDLPITNLTEQIRQLIYSFHMPLFVMMSGSVFAITYSKNSSGYWLKKRAEKLLIPYILVTTLLIIPVRLVAGFYSGMDGVLIGESLFHDFLLGYDPWHLWFCLMLMEVSLLVAALSRFVLSENRRVQILLFIILGAISACQFYFDALPFELDSAARFLFYFYFGYLIEKHREKVKQSWLRLALPLVILLWIAAFFIHSSMENVILINEIPINQALYKSLKMLDRYVMESCGSLVFYVIFLLWNKPLKSKLFTQIQRKSFQVYLFHPPLIMLMKVIIIILIPQACVSNLLYAALLALLVVLSILGSLGLDHIVTKCKGILKVLAR